MTNFLTASGILSGLDRVACETQVADALARIFDVAGATHRSGPGSRQIHHPAGLASGDWFVARRMLTRKKRTFFRRAACFNPVQVPELSQWKSRKGLRSRARSRLCRVPRLPRPDCSWVQRER